MKRRELRELKQKKLMESLSERLERFAVQNTNSFAHADILSLRLLIRNLNKHCRELEIEHKLVEGDRGVDRPSAAYKESFDAAVLLESALRKEIAQFSLIEEERRFLDGEFFGILWEMARRVFRSDLFLYDKEKSSTLFGGDPEDEVSSEEEAKAFE